MKIVVLVIVVAIACFVLFATGVISPPRSRRLQGRVSEALKKGERKGDQNLGSVGDMSRSALKKSRAATNKSAERGRRVHDHLTKS